MWNDFSFCLLACLLACFFIVQHHDAITMDDKGALSTFKLILYPRATVVLLLNSNIRWGFNTD
jgi:hypothetical protein